MKQKFTNFMLLGLSLSLALNLVFISVVQAGKADDCESKTDFQTARSEQTLTWLAECRQSGQAVDDNDITLRALDAAEDKNDRINERNVRKGSLRQALTEKYKSVLEVLQLSADLDVINADLARNPEKIAILEEDLYSLKREFQRKLSDYQPDYPSDSLVNISQEWVGAWSSDWQSDWTADWENHADSLLKKLFSVTTATGLSRAKSKLKNIRQDYFDFYESRLVDAVTNAKDGAVLLGNGETEYDLQIRFLKAVESADTLANLNIVIREMGVTKGLLIADQTENLQSWTTAQQDYDTAEQAYQQARTREDEQIETVTQLATDNSFFPEFSTISTELQDTNTALQDWSAKAVDYQRIFSKDTVYARLLGVGSAGATTDSFFLKLDDLIDTKQKILLVEGQIAELQQELSDSGLGASLLRSSLFGLPQAGLLKANNLKSAKQKFKESTQKFSAINDCQKRIKTRKKDYEEGILNGSVSPNYDLSRFDTSMRKCKRRVADAEDGSDGLSSAEIDLKYAANKDFYKKKEAKLAADYAQEAKLAADYPEGKISEDRLNQLKEQKDLLTARRALNEAENGRTGSKKAEIALERAERKLRENKEDITEVDAKIEAKKKKLKDLKGKPKVSGVYASDLRSSHIENIEADIKRLENEKKVFKDAQAGLDSVKKTVHEDYDTKADATRTANTVVSEKTTHIIAMRSVNLSGTQGIEIIGQRHFSSITSLIGALIDFLIKLVGVIALIFLVIGGFRLVTSSGNDNEYQKSKEVIKYAVIGLVVALLAYLIVRTVQALLY